MYLIESHRKIYFFLMTLMLELVYGKRKMLLRAKFKWGRVARILLYEPVTMSTWFQKHPDKFGTWMHPGTKIYHQIDLVMVRSREKQFAVMPK